MVTHGQPSGEQPRVLHWITHLGVGGAERIAIDLVQGVRNDFESAIFAVHGVDDDDVGREMRREIESSGTRLFTGSRWPLKRGGMPIAAWHGRGAMKEFKPDIVHLHTEIPEAAYASLLTLRGKWARVPIVRTIHSSLCWAYWPGVGRWCESRLRDALVVGVSQAALDGFAQHRARSGFGPPRLKPVVIFNGVALPPAPRQAIDSGRLRLLFAGRFESHKGADLLPAIVAATRVQAGLHCELSVVGSGEFKPALRQMAATTPPGWSITMRDSVPNLAQHLGEFDVVLMPSRVEGLSMLAIEAMLAGTPLIATDATGMREQLPADYPWRARSGDAADFARVLSEAIASRTEWPEVAARAQDFARENFDRGVMLRGYRELYVRVLRGG
jgi:glycosyltransferase involved in cell wall biosynthesis